MYTMFQLHTLYQSPLSFITIQCPFPITPQTQSPHPFLINSVLQTTFQILLPLAICCFLTILFHIPHMRAHSIAVSLLADFTQHDPLQFLPGSSKLNDSFLAEQYSVVYMYYYSFIESSVLGFLGCFHTISIINSVVIYLPIYKGRYVFIGLMHFVSEN